MAGALCYRGADDSTIRDSWDHDPCARERKPLGGYVKPRNYYIVDRPWAIGQLGTASIRRYPAKSVRDPVDTPATVAFARRVDHGLLTFRNISCRVGTSVLILIQVLREFYNLTGKGIEWSALRTRENACRRASEKRVSRLSLPRVDNRVTACIAVQRAFILLLAVVFTVSQFFNPRASRTRLEESAPSAEGVTRVRLYRGKRD